jgi:hypothetical protein
VIPDGLEEPWLEPRDGPGLRALEPLLLPWEPIGWEAVKVRFSPEPEPMDPDAPAKPAEQGELWPV